MFKIISILFVAYILGAIPFSLWLGKLFYKTDVRNSGSKSSGATNVLRVIGPKLAFPILILDILKGFVATRLVLVFFVESDPQFLYLKLAAGVLAMIGHIYPVFAQFKGGKGIATMAGVLLGTVPEVMIYAFPIFVIIVSVTRYVSLGSLLGALSIPVLLFFFSSIPDNKILAVFAFVVFLIALFTHRANVKRLISKTESKINFRQKK
ncbi:MAG: glycerol-3-phosphate 1-O-acyltransferase PlsY [Bacteroidetes bacterium]|jgi:acyl phosphate:glycerol-3-phosphate acyltransferase|nr:glycerol-3-phosphate 1-O-acyltransferase PlsY [Bacteroidota bacterium]MBT7995249.1 glycerol-3-phosphate 1-O-acyltransferase PlsY [Bacteroidota bacterium]